MVDYYYLPLLYCTAACYLLFFSSQNLLHEASNQIMSRAFYEIFGSNSQEESSRHKSEVCTISSNVVLFSSIGGLSTVAGTYTNKLRAVAQQVCLLKANYLVWHSALYSTFHFMCSSSTLHPTCFHQWVCCVSHSFNPSYLPAKLPMNNGTLCCYTYLSCTSNSAVMVLDVIFFHSTSPDVEDSEVSGTSFTCMIICSAI